MSKGRKSTKNNNQPDVHNEIKTGKSCESVWSILDDKNQKISSLKKQLQNQKIQLIHYMRKDISTQKIKQLSESCFPDAAEISMPINLALNQFYKEMGVKNKVTVLHDRMHHIDQNITVSLHTQECILRKIISTLCGFVSHARGEIEFKIKFSHFLNHPYNLDLFHKLLKATVALQKKLDTFRICCNRLIVVEDERNAIVEQVYSLPIEQRKNYNYLIGIQMEKLQMENEVKDILRDQKSLKKRIMELDLVDRKFKQLERQINFDYGDVCINKVLQKVNTQALMLLEKTKEQKKRKEIGLETIWLDNSVNLQRILSCIKISFESIDNNVLRKVSDNMDENKIFELIRSEFAKKVNRLFIKYDDNLEKKRRECEEILDQLNQVKLEKSELKITLLQVQKDLEEIKIDRSGEITRLGMERDLFKTQVDDLEAIRAAYAQLVEGHSDTADFEKDYEQQITEKNLRILELEEQNELLQMQLSYQKNLIHEQENQIDGRNKSDISAASSDRTVQGHLEPPGNESNLPKEKCLDKRLFSEIESGYNSPRKRSIVDNLTPFNAVVPKDDYILSKLVKKNENKNSDYTAFNKKISKLKKTNLKSIEAKVYEDEINVASKTLIPKNISKTCLENSSTFSQSNKNSPIITDNNIISDETAVTTFEIHSIRDGKEEVVKALIKTDGEIKGNIEIAENKIFCLKFNCKSRKHLNNIKELEHDEDDYELLKDCSHETIPSSCVPCRKK